MNAIQEIFEKSKQLYNEAYEIVEGLAKEDFSHIESEKITPSEITRSFDVCLQYSLLQLAISSGELDPNEMIFIRDLTRRGDLLDFVNNLYQGVTPVRWENLIHAKIADLEDWMGAIYKDVALYSVMFVAAFRESDKARVEVDFTEILERLITAIGCGLCFMDGDATSNDLNTDLLILTLLDLKTKD